MIEKNGAKPTSQDYDQIYLNEDRYDRPKELFKTLGRIISQSFKDRPLTTALDAGCATGTMVYYLQTLFPETSFFGMDISGPMLNAARQRVPKAQFFEGSLLEPVLSPNLPSTPFDLVTCVAVLQVFDDWETPIRHLLSRVRSGGSLVLGAIINPEPVDVILRYRDVSRSQSKEWLTGWNVYSRKSLETIATNLCPGAQLTWTDFDMPFEIPKTDDPMRAWTIATSERPFQTINGAGQLINVKFLEVRKP